MIQHISAVTFAVRSMPEAIAFYEKLGFHITFGGAHERFSSLHAGSTFVNLVLDPEHQPSWWGRVIFRVDDATVMHRRATEQSLSPGPLHDGSWGERFFHLTDPDGHELSFAQLLPP